jgi:very-short-patch-repair endonuclease
MAAVLACGRGAAVSHRSAARLWQLLPEEAASPIDVSATSGDHTRRPGIRMHRVRVLPSRDITRLDGIPVTAVARTLCDLAAVGTGRELERALAEALERRLANRSSLLTRVARRAGRAGTARLRALLQADAGPALTRSEAEERFLSLVRRAGLADPGVNVTVGRYEVDFYWPAEALVVEVDGRAFHSSEHSFESDRRRDAELVATGLRVMRVTWKQVADEPEVLLVRLAQALSCGRTGRTPGHMTRPRTANTARTTTTP